MSKIGIDAISFYVPSIYLSIEELSKNRNLNYEKLRNGLGLEKMAIADSNEDPSSFAANALIDLFEKNSLNPLDIGRIYMGTESALDASKPSSTYATDIVEKSLAKKFGERSLKNCDITDMTFACIGGVDALQNTMDWISRNPGKKAIVVTSDLSKYELNSTGEYTQGAGAIAMLISENPSIISIDNHWGIATKSENDFFKPRRTFNKKSLIKEIIAKLKLNISEEDFENNLSNSEFWNNDSEIIEVFKDEPIFNGQFSNSCYINRMQEAFTHFQEQKKTDFLNNWNHLIFHLPYAFHGRRMIFNNWLEWMKNDKKFEDLIKEIGPEKDPEFNKKSYKSSLYKDYVANKVSPGEKASSSIGNMYSASIFMSLLSMLNFHFENKNQIAGEKVGFIGYGSGSKAKIFQGIIQDKWADKIKTSKLFEFLKTRKEISFSMYEKLHQNKEVSPLTNHSARFSHTDQEPNSKGYRYYKIQ
jgi:hydroxymethylglutaryl-CoA synthase|tara:strand:+ start:1387 stop:2808 length:1422 start_codon:yes stop_codon:yes gene_type:complete